MKKPPISAAFKTKVAIAAIRGDKTNSEISSKYEVHSTQITRWQKKAELGILDVFSNKRKTVESQQRKLLDELYKQIGKLKVENEYLQKNNIIISRY